MTFLESDVVVIKLSQKLTFDSIHTGDHIGRKLFYLNEKRCLLRNPLYRYRNSLGDHTWTTEQRGSLPSAQETPMVPISTLSATILDFFNHDAPEGLDLFPQLLELTHKTKTVD